jgi:hypothetical protein
MGEKQDFPLGYTVYSDRMYQTIIVILGKATIER